MRDGRGGEAVPGASDEAAEQRPNHGVVRLGVLGGIRGLEEEEREQERPGAGEHVRFCGRARSGDREKKTFFFSC